MINERFSLNEGVVISPDFLASNLKIVVLSLILMFV
jgi:hypothetical protein